MMKRSLGEQLKDQDREQERALKEMMGIEKTEQEKKVEEGRKPNECFVPLDGYTWNPLRKYPRNYPCFCGSGVKFKKCHQRRLASCLPTEKAKEAEAIRVQMEEYVGKLIERGLTYIRTKSSKTPVFVDNDAEFDSVSGVLQSNDGERTGKCDQPGEGSSGYSAHGGSEEVPPREGTDSHGSP